RLGLEARDGGFAGVEPALQLVDARVQRRIVAVLDAVQVEHGADVDKALAHLALGLAALAGGALLVGLQRRQRLLVRRAGVGQLLALLRQRRALIDDLLRQRVDGRIERLGLGARLVARRNQRRGLLLRVLGLQPQVGRGVGAAALLRRRDLRLLRLLQRLRRALLGGADEAFDARALGFV